SGDEFAVSLAHVARSEISLSRGRLVVAAALSIGRPMCSSKEISEPRHGRTYRQAYATSDNPGAGDAPDPVRDRPRRARRWRRSAHAPGRSPVRVAVTAEYAVQDGQ